MLAQARHIIQMPKGAFYGEAEFTRRGRLLHPNESREILAHVDERRGRVRVAYDTISQTPQPRTQRTCDGIKDDAVQERTGVLGQRVCGEHDEEQKSLALGPANAPRHEQEQPTIKPYDG